MACPTVICSWLLSPGIKGNMQVTGELALKCRNKNLGTILKDACRTVNLASPSLPHNRLNRLQ